MKFAVSFSDQAQSDSDRIFEWLAARSLQGAVVWHHALEQAIEQLQLDAVSYGRAPESAEFSRDIRQKLFKTRRGRTYRLVFDLDGYKVRILRVRGPGQSSLASDDLR
jgi:plasmid stabilization system protein ParE